MKPGDRDTSQKSNGTRPLGGAAGAWDSLLPGLGGWWNAFVPSPGRDGAPGPAEEWNELARRGLELGSRATREIASGSYGPPSMSRDLQDWADLQMRYGLALASLWMGWPGAAAGTAPQRREPGPGGGAARNPLLEALWGRSWERPRDSDRG